MSKKHKRSPARKAGRRIPTRLAEGLEDAGRLMQKNRWMEAHDLLTGLERQYPQNKAVLLRLLETRVNLRDARGYLETCQQLVRLQPDDPDLLLCLAGAYMAQMFPALARRTFRQVLERWPDHPKSAEARRFIAELEGGLEREFTSMGLAGHEGHELAVLHEETQDLLHRSKYAACRQRAEQLLQRRPQFAPAYNNMSLAYFYDGQIDQAISTTQRLLSFEPDNFHALANLTMFQCLSGRAEEARATAQRLGAVQTSNPAAWVKKAEAFSLLGDHQAVVDLVRAWQANPLAGSKFDEALLYHYGAAATLRLGNAADADRWWHRAVELQPSLSIARENLEDRRKPVEQRHGPWPFAMNQWLPKKTIDDLARHLAAAPRGAAATGPICGFLNEHPEVVALVPMFLDRGDPAAREMAVMLAKTAGTPEMLAALRDFVLSDRGPDQLRLNASEPLTGKGLLPAGPMRLWVKGEWREILLQGFEIHGEPSNELPPKIAELVETAIEALQRRDGVAAERLLQQARELAPDCPSVLNNLAMAYKLQGRSREAKELAREIYARFPDYLFGKVAMARIFIEEGELAKAREMIAPLQTGGRLHFTEFSALAGVQIQLCLAEGKKEGARSWVEMLERVYPKDPNLPYYRACLRGPGVLGSFRKWLGG
jgi:Flp pilus assembly protein TadD